MRIAHVAVFIAFAFTSMSPASAQRVQRTTVGRLLAAPADTIEAEQGNSGELGYRSAHLRLTRTDSGFVGSLQFRARRSGGIRGSERSCDTTMTARLAPTAARRLLRLVGSAVIERGEAPEAPRVTDIQFDDWYRLAARGESVVVRNGHAVEHREVRYRSPLKRGPIPRDAPSWALVDQKAPLMKVRELLQSYLQEERLTAFVSACDAGDG